MVQFKIGAWRYRLLIDRIVYKRPLSEIDFNSLGWRTSDNELLHFGWRQAVNGGFQRIATTPLHGQQNLIARAVSSYGNTYLEIKWSPNAIRDSNRWRFHAGISELIDGGYEALLSSSWISYIEIAVEIYHIRTGDFLIYRPRHKHSESIFNEIDGSSTHYLSRRTDKSVYTAYDKTKELRARHSTISRPERCRIENRIKTHLQTNELPTLNNRFNGLLVASLENARNLDKSQEWQLFLDRSALHGVPRATANYSNRLRRIFIKRLAMAKAAWWEPDLIWSHWQNTCNAFNAHMLGLPPTPEACFPR